MIETKDVIKKLNEELSSISDFTRDDVYNTFEPYVNKKMRLREIINLGIFTFDYVHFKDAIEGTVFQKALGLILLRFKQAYKENEQETKELFKKSYFEISKGLAGYTQTVLVNNISENQETERMDLFVRKAFTMIGNNIEECLQAYLHLIDGIIMICKEKAIREGKLGIIVNEIIDSDLAFRSIYKDELLNISVAQWRNIACHNDYVVNSDDTVEVAYGTKVRSTARFSRGELIKLLSTIDTLLYMHKTAYTLLSIDYAELLDLLGVKNKKTSYTIHDDIIMQITETAFAYGLALDSVEDDNVFHFSINKTKAVEKEELQAFAVALCEILQKEYTADIVLNNMVIYQIQLINRELRIVRIHQRQELLL